MYIILSKSGLKGKMGQISAGNRSQNVVKIKKTDDCGFGLLLPVILPHPSISRHRVFVRLRVVASLRQCDGHVRLHKVVCGYRNFFITRM